MPLAGNGDGLRPQVEVTYAPLASTFSRSVDYQFTNGLKVYLSGDTGLHADMKTIVSEFHKANLAVLNLGPNAVTGFSAAYAVNELLKPAAVIASHVNEGATTGGKVRADSRTAAFMSLVKGRPVFLALSGKTMEFDGNAKCVAGC